MKLQSKFIAFGVAAALGATTAQASHFRGGALMSSVDANGLLTVTSTTYWRPSSVATVGVNLTGVGAMSQATNVVDASDARFSIRTQTYTRQLTGAGTYDVTSSSCCRVGGIRNWVDNSLGSSSVSWQLDSRIVWDGSTANTPILFNFTNIQPNVNRNTGYADNLGATSGSGHTLSYTMDNNLGGTVPLPPGYAVDPNTGAITIPQASAAGYNDNTAGNIGADYAFSGTIVSSDGSSAEFDWLFDAVNASANQPPQVNDIVVNALVGDNILETITGSDDVGIASWDLLTFFGPGQNLADSFNPGTQLFSWDTSGSSVGTYIASIRATDASGLTDVGTITINLSTSTGGGQVPAPAALWLIGSGLLAMGVTRRRKAKKTA